jgi:hypothetical protein
MMMRRSTFIALVAAVLFVWPGDRRGQSVGASPLLTEVQARDLWLAPDGQELAARQSLAEAVSDLASDRAASAASVFALSTSDPVLGGYAVLYLGRAQLAAGRTADALAASRRLTALSPSGYLEEASLWLAADAAAAGLDSASALRAVRTLALRPMAVTPVPTIQLRLAREAISAGDRDTAVGALQTIYLDYPLAPEAADAGTELDGYDVCTHPGPRGKTVRGPPVRRCSSGVRKSQTARHRRHSRADSTSTAAVRRRGQALHGDARSSAELPDQESVRRRCRAADAQYRA